jgi:hypothetical protein
MGGKLSSLGSYTYPQICINMMEAKEPLKRQ